MDRNSAGGYGVAPGEMESEGTDMDSEEIMPEADVAYLPKTIFGTKKLTKGQRVSFEIVEVDDEEDGEVEIKVVSTDGGEPVAEESAMIAGVDDIPAS